MNKIKRIISATLVGIMIIPSSVSAFQIAHVENINPIIQTVQLRTTPNKTVLSLGKYEAMPLIDETDPMNAGIKGLWENGKFKYTKEEYNKMLAARHTDNSGLLNVEIGVNPYYEVEIKDNKANLTVSYVNNVMGEESPEEYGLVKINDDEEIRYKTADGKLQPVEILDGEEFTLDPAIEEYGERITKIRLENVPISKLGDANQFIYLENARYVRCYSEWNNLKVDAKPAEGEDPIKNMYGINNFDLNKMVLVESATPGLNKADLQEKVNEAKAIEQGKKTDEALAKLKAAITTAEETLKTATDQEALNQGVATLQAAVEAFKASEDVKLPIEDGIYTAPVRVDHAYDPGKQSMANNAIDHTAKVVYRGDKVTVELTFNGMDLFKMKGHLTNLFFYRDNKDPLNNNDVIEAEVIKTQLDGGLDGKEHDYPRTFRYTMDKSVFETSEFIWIKVWVDAMDAIASGEGPIIPGKGEQNAKIVIDKTNFAKVVLNTQDLSDAIKAAKDIVKGNKKVEEFNILQSVIAEAEKVLKEATDQEDLDKEVTTLNAAVEAFKASGDVKLPTEDGIYLASVEMGHASNPGQKSMANGAIDHIAKLILKEDKVKVELTFKGMDLNGMKGHLTNLFYFENNQDPRSGGRAVETKIEKTFTDIGTDGQSKEFPQVFSFTMDRNLFEASEFIWCRVWVDVMDGFMGGLGKGAQEARIIINKEHLKKVVLKKEALTKEIAEAKKVEQGKKTDEAFNTLKSAITTAEETLKTATDQETLNQGVATLKAAVKAFNESADKVVPTPLEKEALTKEIAEAKKVEQGKKTDEAFNTLKSAITTAEEVLNSATEQTRLDEAVKTLKAAVKAFNESADKVVPGPTPQPEPKPQPKPSYPSYPIYPWYNHSNKVSTSKTNKNTEIKKEEVKNENLNQGKFTDINGHWANKAINYVVNKGYFAGVSKTEFAPDKPITRGEFVTVLGRMLKIDTSKYSSQKFNDVNSSTYYSPYITWANEVGIVSGVGEGNFAPDKALTREEMAVIMSKFLKASNKKLTEKPITNFNDQGSISPWAKEAVTEMAKLGVVKGMGEGNFSPKTEFTRAQVAQVLYSIENN